MPKASFILSNNARRNFVNQSTPNLHYVGVEDCIKFKDLKVEDQLSNDVGRSIVIGVKNMPRQENENRIFGVPSIRHDVSPPRYVSLANVYNYGNEVGACKLLNPYQHSMLGISEEDFSKLRSKQEIKDLIDSIGYKYKIGKFLGIYQRAQQIQGNPDGNVSLTSFVKAMSELGAVQ